MMLEHYPVLNLLPWREACRAQQKRMLAYYLCGAFICGGCMMWAVAELCLKPTALLLTDKQKFLQLHAKVQQLRVAVQKDTAQWQARHTQARQWQQWAQGHYRGMFQCFSQYIAPGYLKHLQCVQGRCDLVLVLPKSGLIDSVLQHLRTCLQTGAQLKLQHIQRMAEQVVYALQLYFPQHTAPDFDHDF